MMSAFLYAPPETSENLTQGKPLSFVKHTAQMEHQLRTLEEQVQETKK